MSSELTSLKSALASARGDDSSIQAALAAYLKKAVPSASGQIFEEQPFARKCGEGVSADECKAIIDNCVSGNAEDQEKCKSFLSDFVRDHAGRGKALADGIKGMDGRMARNVCGTLGIDYNNPNGLDAWMRDLMSKSGSAAVAINSNAPLMDIIKSFVVAASNPSINSKSLEFSRRKASLSAVLPIPARTPRTYEHKSDSAFLTGGGRNVKLVANTYEQYTDSLKRLASMSGGGAELNRTHDEIANIYNSFVYSLKAKGKEIDSNDNLKIRHEIDKLRAIEEKLSKVVTYITRYNALLNSSDKDVQGLVANGTITVDLLEKLNVKYEELKKKHEKKSYGIISITDAINKVLSAADRVDSKLESIKECLGPACGEIARAAKERAGTDEGLASAGAFTYRPSAGSTPRAPSPSGLGLGRGESAFGRA